VHNIVCIKNWQQLSHACKPLDRPRPPMNPAQTISILRDGGNHVGRSRAGRKRPGALDVGDRAEITAALIDS
jgi:hypothetical protein